jgi:hypothetical protein
MRRVPGIVQAIVQNLICEGWGLRVLGNVGYENAVNEKGGRLIWLARNVIDHLRNLRGPGESFSDTTSA